MRVRMAAVALAALSLCGCAAVPPPGPSADEIATYRTQVLEKSWANTGLSGEAPVVVSQTSATDIEWSQSISSCLVESGMIESVWGYGTGEGYALYDPAGVVLDDTAAQRAFYVCAASYSPPASLDAALSDDQLNYIYDYYQTSLVPCMVINGFTPSVAPTRVEFLALAGQWSPYYSVDVGLGPVQYEEIERICGPERPQLY